MTANSRSPAYGAVDIGFQTMSVARRFALGLFSQDSASGWVHVMNSFHTGETPAHYTWRLVRSASSRPLGPKFGQRRLAPTGRFGHRFKKS